eukprot:jgi/Hompol1/546/HPOL_005000-RA
MHVGDLRSNGITVHMSIYSDREAIPAPAIYFVEPTLDNINRISQDMSRQLYDSFNINFSSALPRNLLEELAALAVSSDSSALIGQIYDQYLNFVSLDHNLFSLQMSNVYYNLNNPATTESQIETLTDQIVSSLFSVLVTLGTVPIIRCQRGTCAEAVALKLDGKLRDHLMNTRSNLFSDGIQLSRPVLVLMDRNIDLSTLLSHTWTYSTLVHDILDLKLNRVAIVVEEQGRQVRKNYDVDVNEFFWSKNAGNPFPQVAGDIDAEISKYREEVESVTRTRGVNSLEEIDPNEFSSNAKNLTSAIKQLPELTQRKKTLDMHMNIATSLFKQIQERQLDVFYSMEESLAKLNKATLMELIRDPKKAAQDKLRLFLITGVSNHFENLISGVRNLLPTRRELTVTRIVDAIMEGNTAGTPAEDFLYLDPKAGRAGAANRQPPKGRVTFQEAIVFVIGGGNYLEYHNLLEYAQRSNLAKKKIVYGSTEMLNAKAFIEQLDRLGANQQ